MPAHFRAIVEGGFVDPRRITFTFLEWPKYMNVQVLRPEIKAKVEGDLRELLASDAAMPDSIRKQIQALIEFLRGEDLYPVYGAEFASKTRMLDELRGQNTAKLFPQLESMLSG